MNLYKKQFPKKNPEETILDVLRLSPEEFSNFQKVASQWSGRERFHHSIPDRPPVKLLPSALETLTDTPQQILAALMNTQNAAHNDHSMEFHQGGNLIHAAQSVLGGLWNSMKV